MNCTSYVMASIGICFMSFGCLLLCFTSAKKKMPSCSVNQTETVSGHRGLTTAINCHYSKNRSQYLQVSLRTKNRLCNYVYSNSSWSKQNKSNCNGLGFAWVPQTKEISFQLLNLQIDNSGVYTCTVANYIPPPTTCLGQTRILIDVKAPPSVSVSCVKGSDGASTAFCTSERFFPDDLEQAWLRDGEYISYLNTSLGTLQKESPNVSHGRWNYSKNTDGTYRFTSSLRLASSNEAYHCWVNHSTLSQPIAVTSKGCNDGEETSPGVFLAAVGIGCGVTASIGLIVVACYRRFRKRNYFQSPEAPGTLTNHRPVLQVHSSVGNPQAVPRNFSTPGYPKPVPQVYSTLGNHQPVPCRNASHDSLPCETH